MPVSQSRSHPLFWRARSLSSLQPSGGSELSRARESARACSAMRVYMTRSESCSTSSLTEAVLGERVEKRPRDGYGRADDAERGDGRLEGDHTRDDDHDTLDGISNGVRHRVDAPERLKGHLVVEVVEGAREERGDREVLDRVAC